MSDQPSPRLRYLQHKHAAKQRGVEFDLTFAEWWEIWAPHYHQRGRRPDQMQMCRTADEGAYRTGNVRIDTGAANRAEARVTSVRREIARDWNTGDEDRTGLRDWVHERHRGFQNPLKQLIDAEEEAEGA